MYILGISCFYHDSAAALIRDGQLVAAAMEERFTRLKNDNGFPNRLSPFVCAKPGSRLPISIMWSSTRKPLVKFERILMSALGGFPRSRDVWQEAMFAWLPEKLWVKSILQSHLKLDPDAYPVLRSPHVARSQRFFLLALRRSRDPDRRWRRRMDDHHLGRATANWDGSGSNAITLFAEQRFPHSLGLLYSAFTAFLGFKVNEGEYKVMGMAPYGTPRYVDKIYKLFDLHDDGSFALNLDYFSFQYSATETYNRKFTDLFGERRAASDDFFTPETNPERSAERGAWNATSITPMSRPASSTLPKMRCCAWRYAVRAHRAEKAVHGGRRRPEQRRQLQDLARNAVRGTVYSARRRRRRRRARCGAVGVSSRFESAARDGLGSLLLGRGI